MPVNCTSAAVQEELVVDREYKLEFQGGVCGIYALYAAAHACDADVDLGQIMRSDYADSLQGSSVKHLVDASSQLGLDSHPFQRLSWVSIASCEYPVLLLLEQQESNHWVTFLGLKNGKALIYDQGRKSKLSEIPVGSLVSTWTGVGIRISNQMEKQPDWNPAFPAVARFIALVFVCVGLGYGLAFLQPKLSRIRFVATSLLSFAMITLLSALGDGSHTIWNTELASWFLASVPAEDGKFDEIGFNEFEQLYDSGDAYFIDARPEHSFREGNLQGTLNVPVDANQSEFSDLVSGLDRQENCILFCASSRCRWADIVANKLHYSGFHNIVIFRGGVQVLALRGYRPQRLQKR